MQEWLPNPPDGTEVCGGMDGSENNDWTAIKLETHSGLIFTPRYGPDRRPTIWNPAEWDGKIPRDEVRNAWREITRRYKLIRAYCDPGFRDESSWETEIDELDAELGPGIFIPWVMAGSTRVTAVYAALRRFEADLKHRRITQDGCPITAQHVGNARKRARNGDTYILAKPSPAQKIDAGVTAVLAHEAAADARTSGWTGQPAGPNYFRLPR